MPGFYACTPEWLFNILKRNFTSFYGNPSEELLLYSLLPLNHLREWLCPGHIEKVKAGIEKKSEAARSDKEILFMKLEMMREYEVVRSLCNHSKHYECLSMPLDARSARYEGARAGMARVGDALDVVHFTVDETDIRDILMPVYVIYLDYFSQNAASC